MGAFSDSAVHDRYQVNSARQEMKTYIAGFIERPVVCDSEIQQPRECSPRQSALRPQGTALAPRRGSSSRVMRS
jgi:hypothetical protein